MCITLQHLEPAAITLHTRVPTVGRRKADDKAIITSANMTATAQQQQQQQQQ